MLNEIMQGYFIEKENVSLNESFSKDGIAFLPNLGCYNKGKNLVENVLKADEFEIPKTCHPLIERYVVESYKGHTDNLKPEHASVWKDNYQELEKAILIIKEHLPDFYKELVFANKTIYLHDNPKMIVQKQFHQSQ